MNAQCVLPDAALVRAIHSQQLAFHGGRPGIRDNGLLDSAVQRPHNLAVYGCPDVPALAASVAFGIARTLPFVAGNTRTAFLVGATLLETNEWRFAACEVDLAVTFLALAAGDLGEEALAEWFRANGGAPAP
jgi:death-on-curing protein